jgi:hypothetical protein
MAWQTIFDNDQISLAADSEHKRALLELSSGGYRPRYVTLQMSSAELDELIAALQQAKAAIGE